MSLRALAVEIASLLRRATCQMCERPSVCMWLAVPAHQGDRPVRSGWYCAETCFRIAGGLAIHGDPERAMREAGFDVLESAPPA